jgi:glycosyltransferase involved in cell wall biosynthesis
MPKISVLMPVYNGEKHLREAIESILKQPFTDFEFIIIDDGSTDSSAAIVQSFPDQRIIYRKNEVNLGLAASLNIGLKLAKGKYLARMDADDIARPERLQTQFDYLESHPDIDLCGSWIKIIGTEKIWKMPTKSEQIPALLLFGPTLFHPTVFWRQESFLKNNLSYNEAFRKSQDYELWARAAKVIKIVNLKDVLLDYRVTEEQIKDFQNSPWRQDLLNSVRQNLIKELVPAETATEELLHQNIANGLMGNINLAEAETWLIKLGDANREKNIYAQKPFTTVIRQEWLTIVLRQKDSLSGKLKHLISSHIFGGNLLQRISSLLILIIEIKLS